MVHILPHHFLGVFNGLLLPILIADMLPAGNFGKHQQSQLIAARYEVLRLRIVRGAHGVNAKLVFEYLGVKLLHRFRHGIADIGV